jgi:hypothetical protein
MKLDLFAIIVYIIFILSTVSADRDKSSVNNEVMVDEKEPWFPIWGVYCGLWHTNHYGVEPIDEMDRYCQFHDICVTIDTQGYSSCWCNEQLYYHVSNFRPSGKNESEIKDSILSYIYIAINRCTNHWGFDTLVKVTKVRSDVNERGFNYIVLYPHNFTEKFIVQLNSTDEVISSNTSSSFLIQLTKEEFGRFVVDVHTDPINNIKNYTNQIIHTITEKPFIVEQFDSYIVLYNNNPLNEETYQIKNVTECYLGKNTTHYINTTVYEIVYETVYETVIQEVEEYKILSIVEGIILGFLVVFTCVVLIILVTICFKYRKLKNENSYDKIDNSL